MTTKKDFFRALKLTTEDTEEKKEKIVGHRWTQKIRILKYRNTNYTNIRIARMTKLKIKNKNAKIQIKIQKLLSLAVTFLIFNLSF